jgi:hypothetical protein
VDGLVQEVPGVAAIAFRPQVPDRFVTAHPAGVGDRQDGEQREAMALGRSSRDDAPLTFDPCAAKKVQEEHKR